MRRFFVSTEQLMAEKLVISGPDAKHAARVLRLEPGDVVELLDGSGRGVKAKIESLGNTGVVCSRLEEFNPGGEPRVRVTLVQGLAKGDKMDLVIQKATELGVTEIIPMICHRSVMRLEGNKALERQRRWQRVAMEAAKQCRRARVPEVRPLMGLSQVLEGIPEDAVSFFLWEGERERSFGNVLHDRNPGRVYVFIGPEGGFEESEVEEARQRGAVTITLGSRILRTETAGLVSITIIMHHWGELG